MSDESYLIVSDEVIHKVYHEGTKDGRFDVEYNSSGADISYHYCREWVNGVGCYGTNPEHGFSFEEAKIHVSDWYSTLAEYWKNLTFEEWSGSCTSVKE